MREVLPLYLLTLFILGFLVVSGRLVQLLEWILPSAPGLGGALGLIPYLLPSLAAWLLPVAWLIALMLAFSRLSSDAETVALMASGVGIPSLLRALFPVTLALFLLMAATSLWIQPKALGAAKRELSALVESAFPRLLQPGRHLDAFKGLTLYYEESLPVLPPDSRHSRLHRVGMHRVLVRPDPKAAGGESVLTAREGEMTVDPESQTLVLSLRDGELLTQRSHEYGPVLDHLRFGSMELAVQLEIEGVRNIFTRRRAVEMTNDELRVAPPHESDKDRLERLYERGQRASTPFAIFVFGLVGVPMGIRFHRWGRAGGFLMAGGVVIGYYLLAAVGQSLIRIYNFSPLLAMNLPNLVLGMVGALMVAWKSRRAG